MRPWFFALGLTLALTNPSLLRADDPPLPADVGIAWPQPSISAAQPLPAEQGGPPRAVGPQRFDTEVLIGFPTEVRVQWAAVRGTNTAFLLEGIVGAEVIPIGYGILGIGVAGVGGRLRCAVCNGERNAFVLKPGADAYAWFTGSGAAPLGGADVELLWWHNCGSGNRFGFQMGVDLGAGFGYNGFNWFAFPMVSAIVGLHF